MIQKKPKVVQHVIDLTGPEGNSFNLLGITKRYSEYLGYTKEETDKLLEEMMSGDYENLIETFDKHFGSFVVLYR